MRRIRRQNPPLISDDEVPPGWQAAMDREGELGPWKRADRPEFWHAGTDIIEWILRADKSEVENLKYTLKLGFWVQTVLLWGRRIVYLFTGGLALAVAAGENFSKLKGMIFAIFSLVRGG